MNTKLTKKEYTHQLDTMADDIVLELLELEITDIDELVRPVVLDNQYIIDTSYHSQIIELSDNDISEVNESLEATTDLAKLTYELMCDDVREIVTTNISSRIYELESEIYELESEIEDDEDENGAQGEIQELQDELELLEGVYLY